MNNRMLNALLGGLLMLFILAPFAGLAPLMLVVLCGGVLWSLKSFWDAFFESDRPQEPNSEP